MKSVTIPAHYMPEHNSLIISSDGTLTFCFGKEKKVALVDIHQFSEAVRINKNYETGNVSLQFSNLTNPHFKLFLGDELLTFLENDLKTVVSQVVSPSIFDRIKAKLTF